MLDANATAAAQLLYWASLTSHDAFHNISAADLRPTLSLPLLNQVVAKLVPASGMLKVVSVQRCFAYDCGPR